MWTILSLFSGRGLFHAKSDLGLDSSLLAVSIRSSEKKSFAEEISSVTAALRT